MLMAAWDPFCVTFVLWLATMGILEFLRLQRTNRLPWWVVHGPVIAWGAVALIPWLVAMKTGFWLVPPKHSATVPLTLPATYGFIVLALIGLAVGTAPFAVVGRRATQEQAVHFRTTVAPGKAFIVIVILLTVYIISLPSWSNLWSLTPTSGDILYGTTNGSFLSLSLVVLVAMAVAYVAEQQALSWVGIALYVTLLVVALGSAHRYLITILILSYVVLRRPNRYKGGTPTQALVLLALGAAAVWLIGFSGLGQLSVLRSGRPASTPSVYTQKTLSSFDVMSSAEYLMESGAQACQLHGASYLALPDELIPRFLLGSRATPPALVGEQETFGIQSGASAPLWMEGVLNLGWAGDFLSMVIFGGLWCVLIRKALSSQGRLGRTIASIGPVWIFFAYQALSRMLMLATIRLFGSVILGLLLWNWMQADASDKSGDLVDVPASAERGRPVRRNCRT